MFEKVTGRRKGYRKKKKSMVALRQPRTCSHPYEMCF